MFKMTPLQNHDVVVEKLILYLLVDEQGSHKALEPGIVGEFCKPVWLVLLHFLTLVHIQDVPVK